MPGADAMLAQTGLLVFSSTRPSHRCGPRLCLSGVPKSALPANISPATDYKTMKSDQVIQHVGLRDIPDRCIAGLQHLNEMRLKKQQKKQQQKNNTQLTSTHSLRNNEVIQNQPHDTEQMVGMAFQ